MNLGKYYPNPFWFWVNQGIFWRKPHLPSYFPPGKRYPGLGTKICPFSKKRCISHYIYKIVESRFIHQVSPPRVCGSQLPGDRRFLKKENIRAQAGETPPGFIVQWSAGSVDFSVAFPLPQLRSETDFCVVRTHGKMLQDRLHSTSLDLLLRKKIIGSGEKKKKQPCFHTDTHFSKNLKLTSDRHGNNSTTASQPLDI